MSKYWKVAERYTTILQRVLDEYAEYESTAGTSGERVTPSSVKILADMRRCAFDLDFLISRQPRNQLTAANTPRRAVTPARNLGPSDLEYLDVFGFFNVPRLPAVPVQMQQLDGTASNGGGGALGGMVPGPPNTAGGNESITANLAAAELSAEGGAAGAADMTGAAVPMVNEFNITNYMVPTPETDWLFRNAT